MKIYTTKELICLSENILLSGEVSKAFEVCKRYARLLALPVLHENMNGYIFCLDGHQIQIRKHDKYVFAWIKNSEIGTISIDLTTPFKMVQSIRAAKESFLLAQL